MTYIHEAPNWPNFTWDHPRVSDLLAPITHRQGRLLGRMESLNSQLRKEALLESLTSEVLRSSEIEGEILRKDQVRSSLARHLGINIGALTPADRNVDGVVEMLLDATQNFRQPLTDSRLFDWHKRLFPQFLDPLNIITIGAWRTDHNGRMQIVSGPIGRRQVHYEAPPAARLDSEMRAFLNWFNADSNLDLVLKAALAHLWFVNIHPFDDGNGRIARAITDLLLARSENTPQRFYSMSAQILKERNAYYDILESTGKGSLDITPWMQWFLQCLDRALQSAELSHASALQKSRFWQRLANEPLNPRQHLILNRLLDNFQGNLTTTKYAKLGKCSHDTALRDIEDLVKRRVLIKGPARGRSTSYSLVIPS